MGEEPDGLVTAAVECMAAAREAKSMEVGKTVFVVVTVTVTTVVGILDTVKVERVVGMTGGEEVEVVAEANCVSSCLDASTDVVVLGRWPMVVVAMVGRARVPVNVTRVRVSSSSGSVSSPLAESSEAGMAVEKCPET